MSAIDDVITANAARPERTGGALPSPPARALAVVTCMDARLVLPDALGLGVGDAHYLRNAGGLVTDDTLRSLAISQRALGTREIAIIQHTRCGMAGFDDAAFRADLEQQTGVAPTWDVPGFDDVDARVREAVETVRACPWLPERDGVRGFVYDVDTDHIRSVE